MLVNVARTLARSAVNGPGERYVLWAQGCPLACPSCWNPDTWSFKKRVPRKSADLADEILATSGIEGATFTGGEPFAQAAALAEIAATIKDGGLSLFIFTGYTLEELSSPDHQRLLAHADILVSGRYVDSLRSNALPWRGSTNQEVHFLSGRYGPDSIPDTSSLEFHLNPDVAPSITGFPIEDEWRTLL